VESEVCSEVEVQTDGQQRQTGERVTGALLAAAAGRRGEPGEREREAGVQASGYANARKYWAAGIAWGF